MSNFHFNINYRLQSKQQSRQILKLDNLRSSSTLSSCQPQGIEHILINRMCEGKLKQQCLLNQLFSKQSSRSEQRKQKGFYYEDQREVASVKEFFHFYKLVSSEKNNIQRQEFNESLQKKTQKIIHMLHEKNQSYKSKQINTSEDVPIKSINVLLPQSSKEIFNYSQQHAYFAKQRQAENTINQINIPSNEQKLLHKIPSLEYKHLSQNQNQMQRKSSFKDKKKAIPALETDLSEKNYFISPFPSQKNLTCQDEQIIPTSQNKQLFIFPKNVQTIKLESIALDNPNQNNKAEQQQTNQCYQITNPSSNNFQQTQKPLKQRENNIEKQLRVNDLNLSDISQGKQLSSTLQSNTASRRQTNLIPNSARSNVLSQQSQRGIAFQGDQVKLNSPLVQCTNQCKQEEYLASNQIQNQIEFKNSKIQQLMNDFNDSILEIDQKQQTDNCNEQHDFKIKQRQNSDQIIFQGNQNSQKSLFLKQVTRNNSFNEQPYIDIPLSNVNQQEFKQDKATVSFSLPQSAQKSNINQNQMRILHQKFSSMANLNLQNSLNESTCSVPQTRGKSHSPPKVDQFKISREIEFEDDNNELSKKNDVKQFQIDRKKSLQFTMKHADKFLHTHDSLAGTKANIQNRDKKLQFIGQIFKSASNFDIIISNQINQSIEKKKKQQSQPRIGSSQIYLDKEQAYDNQKSIRINTVEKENFKEEGIQSQESDFEIIPQAQINNKRTISYENFRKQRPKSSVDSNKIIEEENQNTQIKNRKTAFLNVQKIKIENLITKDGKKFNSKAIKNLEKDIGKNIHKIDSLLANKTGKNLYLDEKRINSPLSYTQKQFHTRAEVVKHFKIQKYFDIQKTLAIDYSNAKKNIYFQQQDNKVYTKNTDYIKHFH
ncbi:hypothetical protein ABPG72_008744 [Tetrahymena utriculariae]